MTKGKGKTNTPIIEPASISVVQQPAKTIRPITVEATKAPETIFDDYIEVPNGHVYIVQVKDGNELPNTGFFYPEKNHLRFYGDTTKFLVKKKATK